MKKYLKKIMPLCIVILAIVAIVCADIPTEAAAKKPTKITLQTTAKTIDVKGKATVSVKSVTPKSASKEVTFSSSNKKIATVSSKGVVTGKKAGKVTITATSKKNSKVKAKITLQVKNIKPKSMSINYTSMKVEVGKSKTLKVTAKPAGVYCPLKWTSSDKSIATVDKNGVVTGKKNGTVTITCKSTVKNSAGKYMTKKCKVTVLTKVKSLKANEDTLTLNVKDATGTVKFTVSPKTASNKKLTYSSSNKNVAVVDKSGKVTATGYGTATITAKTTDGTNKSASYTVKVVKPEAVAETQVFVSPEYAKAAIDGLLPESENLLVAEVSWGAYASASAYNEAHIPGALHINSDAVEYDDCDPWPLGDGIDDLAQYGDEYHYGANEVLPEDNFNIRSSEQLTQFMKTYGITQDTNVILYGNNASNSAVTRVAFAMLYAGVDNVKVVDGGFKAWKAAGLPTETTINKPVATDKDFGVTIPEHPEYIMSVEDVQKNLETNPNFNLVSIRSRDEFEGKTSGYGYIEMAGEPEGAIWGKDTDDGTYVQNGKIASIDALKQYIEEGGGSYDNELSFYCGTGWRATIPFLMAYQDGKTDISLYDGGWWLWTVKQENEADKYPIQRITPEQAAKFVSINYEKDSVTTKVGAAVDNKLTIKYPRTELNVTYSSSDENVATVDADGKVTVKGTGAATITASVEGDDRTAAFTVVVPVDEKQVFVSPEYVNALVEGKAPESRKMILAEVSWGAYASASAYNEAHVPGALHINSDAVEYDDCDPWPYGDGIDDLAQYGDEYHYGANEVLPEDNFNIRSREQLTQFMKTYGITQDTTVVLYGNNASNSAVTRVAFAMLYAGVDNVKVMDGGFKAWKAAGLPTETTVNKPVATNRYFGVRIPEHPEYIMSVEDVQKNLETNPNFNLVSIRSRDEFEGKTSGYGYIDFAGEPEGAIWGKDTDDGTYVQDGKIASIDALKQYVKEGGGSYDNELSFYCGTGWRATIPFLMAYQDGKKDISLYDGGWWLWTVKQENEADKYPVQTITPEQAARFAKMSFENEEVSVAVNKTVKNDLVIKYQRTDLKITYTSDNEAVATVAEDGTVTAVGTGTATITASVDGDERTASYKVTVNIEKEDVLAYGTDGDNNTVLVDARLADVYQGWAVDGNEKGGHLEGAVNVSAQWLDCSYSSNKKENKTREEAIQKELDALGMTANKKYMVYDTNGKDAEAVAAYLKKLGFNNVATYNANELVKETTLVSYANYDLWIPAEVVKNISDHVVNGTDLSTVAKNVVKSDDIVLLDVSWGTVEESGFLDGHVPGSVHVNTDDYETPKVYIQEKDEPYRSEWRLNTDEELLKLAANSGITKDSCVIITGYEPMATTRMGIILKYLGCDNVHVMSEALVGWDALGYAYETGERAPKAVESFGVTEPQNPDLIDTIEEAEAKVGTAGYQLIDTRTIEEWNGTSSGYGYHDLAGRIEGTVHSPSGVGYSSSMYYYRNPDMSMRSKEVLEAMWASQGIDPNKHMAFFCGSGWRAAEETWDALVIGYTDVSLYSDGWIGWSNEGKPYIDKDGNTVRYDKVTNSVVSAE